MHTYGTHPDDQDRLEALGRELLRGAGPPKPPGGLRSRALAAARRKWRAVEVKKANEQPSPLDRWIGTLFRSRVLWTAWAVAMLLALALRPPLASDTLPVYLDGAALDFEAPAASARPSPTGPLLRDTYATSAPGEADSSLDSWRRPS